MKHLVYKTAVAIVAIMVAGSLTSAGAAPLGASDNPSPKAAKPSVTGITPSNVYFNASHASGGCALRNLGACGLNVSGGPGGLSGYNGPAQAAKLYWSVLIPPSTTAPPSSVALLIALPNVKVTAVTGVLVATAADPCWGSGGAAIYKGAVPLSGLSTPATGNYSVIPVFPAPGSTTGGDPWNSPVVFPAYEGASLVVAGTGTNTVSLYDKGLPGKFIGNANYTLFVATGTTSFSRFDNINADGQIGGSITPIAGLTGEDLSLNGVLISGAGAPNPNGDYDGNTGAPLPLLWDDEAHDVTGVPVTDPATSAVDLNVVVIAAVTARNDCLVTVAHVVASSP
jgi:hypothetical protein